MRGWTAASTVAVTVTVAVGSDGWRLYFCDAIVVFEFLRQNTTRMSRALFTLPVLRYGYAINTTYFTRPFSTLFGSPNPTRTPTTFSTAHNERIR